MVQKDHPLVSMITYCYNGARFIHKYFEAILAQTYDNIELIFFENGSEDNTHEIAQSYLPKLKQRGIQVQYIRNSENQCTCVLKQKGFELMHGDYFFGCDSDDLIHPEYIEKMLGYLLSHPDKGIVFCQLRTILETTGEQIGVMKVVPNPEPRGAFLDMLHAKNTFFTAISHMISRRHFLQVNPEMKIHISLYGENYQILLPLLYNDLQGYIQEPLGDYSVRYDSYTGKLKKDPKKQILAYRGQEESISATLKQIGIADVKQYDSIYRVRLRTEAFYSALGSGDKQLKKECYHLLKEVGGVTFRTFVSYHFPFARKLAIQIFHR